VALYTTVAPVPAPGQPFEFRVPGQYSWKMLGVIARIRRHAIGPGTRHLELSIANGQHVVGRYPYIDPELDTSILTVSWSDAAAINSPDIALPVVSVPFPQRYLEAGYKLTGTIIAGHPADRWESAIAWWEYGA